MPLAGGRIICMSAAQLTLKPGLSDGSSVTIDAAYDNKLGRVVATAVQVKRNGAGGEITTRKLHEIHIQNALIKVVMNQMLFALDENQMTQPAAEIIDQFAPAKGRPRSETTRDAALIYTIATVANWPPLKTVADKLSVSQSTATRLVAEARTLGMLDDG